MVPGRRRTSSSLSSAEKIPCRAKTASVGTSSPPTRSTAARGPPRWCLPGRPGRTAGAGPPERARGPRSTPRRWRRRPGAPEPPPHRRRGWARRRSTTPGPPPPRGRHCRRRALQASPGIDRNKDLVSPVMPTARGRSRRSLPGGWLDQVAISGSRRVQHLLHLHLSRRSRDAIARSRGCCAARDGHRRAAPDGSPAGP